MSNEQTQTQTTTPTPTPTTTVPADQKYQAVLDKLVREDEEKQRAVQHEAMLNDLKKDEKFKIIFDKYGAEIFNLNPTLKTNLDSKSFRETFITAADVLLERDKKIQASTATTTTQTTTTQPPANPELDKPVPVGNGVFKNAKGEVTDGNGMRLVSETVRIPDVRDAEMDADATPVEKARLETIREAQKTVKRFERPVW